MPLLSFSDYARHLVQPGRALAFVSSVRTSTSVHVSSSKTGTSISNSQVTVPVSNCHNMLTETSATCGN
jgi:hypothetical protein